MTVNLLGVQVLDFKNESGQSVKGVNIHFAYDPNSDYIFGQTVCTKFLTDSFLGKIGITSTDLISYVGKEIGIDCDLNKHIVDIYPVDPEG